MLFFEPNDYLMSIYNPDDHGFDEYALQFQRLLTQHDGFLIAKPEYNGPLPEALKYVID